MTALTQAQLFAQLAEAALREGQAAGDPAVALRWFDRAHRIAPKDAGIALTFAVHLRGIGLAGRAATLLKELAAAQDSREVWFALAAVRHELASHELAAAALAQLLSGFAWPRSAERDALATAIARAADAPGWCGFDGARLIVRPVRGRAEVRADGEQRRGTAVAPGVQEIDVRQGGLALLGSPLRIGRMRRVEGVVRAVEGGLEGWAWHPGAPDRDPRLIIEAPGRPARAFTARDHEMVAPAALARPRRFTVAIGGEGPISVRAVPGGHLFGSPVATTAASAPRGRGGAPAPRNPARPVAVVVPVFGQAPLVEACLSALRQHLPPRCRVIVVDDGSPDAATKAVLASARGVRVIRLVENRGFPAAANVGMSEALALRPTHDVVLLNSDTVVTAGWLEALRAVIHGTDDAGTATPLSNDATILSYPDVAGGNLVPDDIAELASLAARANGGRSVAVPTAVGFCMYIRHECLRSTGLFREDVFAQGYGEENDFCRRAETQGWRHLAAPGVFVAHVGGRSFGAARAALIERNMAVLEELHPGYHAAVARFRARDPLAPARRRLDMLRWRQRGGQSALLLITHGSGGGVERVVQARAAAARAEGLRPVVLRSVLRRDGPAGYEHGLCQVEEADQAGATFPNLRFQLPRETAALLRLLRADRPVRAELHHLVGHDHAVAGLAARLGVPLDIHVHDYAAFCPRISLVGRGRRYCGEPSDPADCDACVAATGHNLSAPIAAAALRARSAADFAAASRVVVPSADAASRLRRHFPGLEPEVRALEDDKFYPPARGFDGAAGHIGVIGGIGVEKGLDVLLACARDVAARGLNLRFTVIGHTSDDEALLATGRVFVTGPYKETEAVALIRHQDVQLAWQPSIWPETWCFTLGLAWRAGLGVAAFDLGAPAERIRRTGRGWLMPLGLPPPAINDMFLGLRSGAGLESGGQTAYQPSSIIS